MIQSEEGRISALYGCFPIRDLRNLNENMVSEQFIIS